jgi:signal transduction histidine kinase
MITHELKTPLVPIQGYCKNLKNPKMGELNEQQTKAVDEIFNNSVELLNLIQNILNAQKIELHQLKFDIKNISLDEYMEEKYSAFLSIMKEKNIQFKNSTEKELSVKVDPARLNEIITNLVQNSVDFVPNKNGVIEIGAKEHEKQILFYIKDNGVGIPEDKMKNMFKKFYQIDTSITRKHGGSGLGLSICKGYVEGMGGKMWVESKPDIETTFYFTLPKSN